MTQHPQMPPPPAMVRRTPGLLQPRSEQRELLVAGPGVIRAGQETLSAVQAQEIAEEQAREELIQRLGIPTGADDVMDQFALQLAENTGLLYGFVNIFRDRQMFVGLYNPPSDSGHIILDRTMDREHGWCPAVVKRRRALPLADVHASPRFSGNYVVDAIGVRSYFGAPLIHEESGVVLGTVCGVDPEARPRSDARRILDIVKATGADVLHTLTTGAPAH
ncbi:GAF domain-containing protein [Streptomyces sp. W16]|uniref:GAF domain-containing protein n=1 Tax=Streptomyces sp. W16 TaxID=3076631 RepID=UPI00295A8877|nr:GAF domain-containing protein [Streptomyces sp. W16]MDV9168614.1 GAF domain-containing protein [Streptomyces sp. W16]